MRKSDFALFWGACLLMGCSAAPPAGSEDLPGEATLAITNAPADATCLRVNVVGSRLVTRLFDLMPGQSTVFTLGGLPLGSDTFTENAFALPCGSVTSSSVATWVSDPTTAVLQAGIATSLTIVLRRNGTAIVSTDFQDDPDASACVPAGGACMVSSSCCAGNSCVGGVCSSATCPPPQQLCMTPMGTSCVDVSSNVSNCGSCGTVCNVANGTPACAMGICIIASCNSGFANCNGNLADGCETNIVSNVNNCGACGQTCMPMSTCVNGACVTMTSAPSIVVNPPSVVFPTTPVGGSSSITFGISNPGGSLLIVNSVIVTNDPAEFHVMSPPSFNVPPGANFIVPVQFTPTAIGARQGNISIQSNDPMRPVVQVPLQGFSM